MGNAASIMIDPTAAASGGSADPEGYSLVQHLAYQTVAGEPYHNSLYKEFYDKNEQVAISILGSLLSEFAQLVEIQSSELIQKCVCAQFIALKKEPDLIDIKNDGLDIKRMINSDKYLQDVVQGAIRVIGEDRWGCGLRWGFDFLRESAYRHITIAGCAIEKKLDDEPNFTKWQNSIFNAFVNQVLSLAGVDMKADLVVDRKSIQSLFNKMYIRRGQMQCDVIGDMMRATLLLETPDQLAKVIQTLKETFQSNFDKGIDKAGDLRTFLTKAGQLQPMQLTIGPIWEDWQFDKRQLIVFPVPYRLKPNSSQAKVYPPELWNLNFFYDGGPRVHIMGHDFVAAGCEIQIGLKSTVESLRAAHKAYDKDRITEGLPLLTNSNKGERFVDNPLTYDLINKYIRGYDHVRTVPDSILTFSDHGHRIVYTPGKHLYPLYCTNNRILNSIGDGGSMKSQILWTGDVNPEARYTVKNLVVNIADQGWGNASLNACLYAQVGDKYVIELASRYLHVDQRGKPLVLVKNFFTFSLLQTHVMLPAFTDKLLLVVWGQLIEAGHSMSYEGFDMEIGVFS